MKVLVTGAAGFIGGQLWHTLWKRGDEVVGIDNFSYGNPDNLKFDDHDFGAEVRRMDIRDKAGMLALFEAEKFDVVYNIAGIAPLPDCQSDPVEAVSVNTLGLVNVLENARRTGVKHVIQASTNAMYENETEFPTVESKFNPPTLIYPNTKYCGERFCQSFADTYGMPTVVTNCSNNYGPYQFPEKLIPLFINNIRHKKPLPVYGKGENVRDWLYVEDHARAIDLIFHNGKTADTYNIGGFNEWKNIDIIKVVIKTVDRLLGRAEGKDMNLITYVTDRKGHDMRYAIDSRKLQRELGWEPSLQFEEGIEKTVRWYLDNQAWMDNVTSGGYQKYYDEMYKNR